MAAGEHRSTGGGRSGKVAPRTRRFGPGALATPANALTIARLAGTPLVMGVYVATGPAWPVVALWVFLASSDGLDGFVARRQGATRSGAFLDPLADKLLVLGMLALLAAQGTFGWLPVALIAAREVSMSAYRSMVGRRGISVPARRAGKLKALAEDVTVAVAVAPITAGDHALVGLLLWASVVLAYVSGTQYVMAALSPQASGS